MLDKLTQSVRRRSREEWQALTRQRWEELLDWAHDHGELAAICGFLLGVAIVVAFRFFLSLLFVAAVVAFVIWKVARPSDGSKPQQ
jgi:hypothetical protein